MKILILLLSLLVLPAYAENVSIYLDEAPLADVVKLAYGEIAKKPYVLASSVLEARQPVTLSLRDVSPAKVIDQVGALLAAAGFAVESRAGVVFIDRAQVPRDEIIVYKPRYRSARYLSDIVQPLTGAKSLLSRVLPMQVQQTMVQPGMQGHAQQYNQGHADTSMTSVAGMTDKGEADQIAFTVPLKDVERLRKLLVDLDTPTGEVLLKAAVYEVGTNKQQGSAMQVLLSLSGIEASLGGSVAGDASIKVKFGGLEGLITALDRDTRFKSLSRPRVRVKNGAQARFSVGQDVPILGSQQLDRNGNPIQSIEYKPSGVILTARPEIRADVIELDLQQELSNFTSTSTGVNNSPTLIKRSVSTRLGIVPGEVVVMAGLQDEKQEGQQARIPLIDFLFGDAQQQQHSEILVFIEAERI